ncbi:MAG TPA: hypothetical protein VJM08_03610 [Anaerolineales bacterium]|nr:hypothetical protein [Anaerolineales bacterium]
MHATSSLNEARGLLDNAIRSRLWNKPIMEPVEKIRFPTGIFFMRERGGTGQDLAEQVKASFAYWNKDSGQYFDVVFPGWGNDGGQFCCFNFTAFTQCKNEFQNISKWRYSGETDILLLNYDYKITHWSRPQSFIGKGDFALEEVILLPVEVMIRDGRVSSLDALMQELVNSAKLSASRSDKSVLWELRDRVAFERTRKAAWEGLKAMFLKDMSRVYNELRPFVMCDLRIE